jgi:hypothetical protein
MTEMNDLMDRRIASAARRWQAEQPVPPEVPLDRLEQVQGRTVGWRAALAAAAAVVLVGGGAAAIIGAARGGDTPTASTGTPTRSVHPVGPLVPWRNLPASRVKIGHRLHGRWVTPFDNLMANGEIRGHFHPGDTLRFVVYLESFTDVPLRPCPDYTVAIGARFVETWRLNCRQVPFRIGTGRPLLPAGRKVTFAMRVPVPDEPGRQKVLWTIDGPSAMPGFYGIIHIS